MKKFSWSNKDIQSNDDYEELGLEESIVNIISSPNFEISDEDKKNLENKFYIAQEKLPIASCINLTLRRCEDMLKADLVINSLNVRFRVNSESDNNGELFNNLFNLLDKEIKYWRQHRFQERVDIEESYEGVYSSL